MPKPDEILRIEDFTRSFCQELVKTHGDIRNAARAVGKQCRGERNQEISWASVEKWIGNAIRDESLDILKEENQKVNHLKKLLEDSGVDILSIGKIKRSNLWQGQAKVKQPDGSEKVVVSTMAGIELDPSWKEGPKFPVIQQAAPTAITFAPAPRILRKIRTIVIPSDTQIGALRDTVTHLLDPMHDPRAMDLATQIIHDVQPDTIAQIGDLSDNSQLSNYSQHPEFDRTTQPSIDCAHRWLATWRAAAGKSLKKFLVIGGNHDNRFERYLLAHAKAALGLRRAASPPEDWPVFSMPYMLRFDQLGIEYSGTNPGGVFWLLNDLVLVHEPPKKHEFAASVLHGHTHKLTRTPSVTHARHGHRNVYAVYDTGCLCRVDSNDNPKSLLQTTVASDRGRTDWNQGLAVVEIIEGKIPIHQVTQIQIWENGTAIYGGKTYESRIKDMRDPLLRDAA